MTEHRRRKWSRVLFVIGLGGLGLFAVDRLAPADIRPDNLPEQTSEELSSARARLESLRAAHGSDAWEQYSVMDVHFRDEWPFWLTRAVLSPWDVSDQALRARMLRRSWTTEVTLLNGDAPGERWGLQSWKTWRSPPDGTPRFDESWVIGTMVPGLRYFLELPLTQDTATFVQNAGTAMLDERPHERLYVTWNQSAPQRDFDQYVLWLDPDTGLVARVDFTIRALSGLAVATATFRDYRDYGGVKFPGEIVIDGVLPTGHTLPVHTIRVSDVQWDTFDAEALRPDPSLEELGETKPRSP